ncbi:MAG: hypothetical protein JW725_00360 [Candidatus Babeliaceae bacterium]|nr:hypothetical protein [Candidatus Babeliaceae bacterium]
MTKHFSLDETQLVISPELLAFLRWLVQNEPETLKRLVKKALREGVSAPLSEEQTIIEQTLNMQEIVADFFSLLDLLIVDAQQANKKEVHSARTPTLISKTAEQVDSSICDDNIVAFSVARAAQAVRRNTKLDARQALFKEILKNWSPRDKNIQH